MTYAGQYSDASGTSDPQSLDPIERARADAGLPINSGPERPTFVPDSFGAAAGGQLPADGGSPGGAPGQPMAAGVRATERQSERDAELPTAGSLLNSDPTGSPFTGRGMAGFGSGAVPSGSFRIGAADLNSQATPAYSPTQAPTYSNEQTQLGSDEYLASVSDESLEKVLQHFGLERQLYLTGISCVVEDALLAQAQQTAEVMQQLEQLDGGLQAAQQVIDAAAEDNAAYHVMLTDPDMLAAYVEDFFGPEGPYPTETAEDRLRAEIEANEVRFAQPQAAPAPQAPAYQRPEIDMPQPGVQASGRPDDFWSDFSAISERNPALAWQMLSQAGPDALRSKVLVSEG